ncbi:MAG: hypothetical protein ACRC4M_00095, partial [Mycoplasma sp.]
MIIKTSKQLSKIILNYELKDIVYNINDDTGTLECKFNAQLIQKGDTVGNKLTLQGVNKEVQI